MSALTPQALITGSVEINSLPEIFTQINELVDDPYCSVNDISKVVLTDPSLTARLLKLVNSPFYGFPSEISTISRAVAVIGMQELRDLVLATSVTRMFKGIPSDLVNMTEFWHQSVYCGLVARAIATRINGTNREKLFVAGMLHRIGSLVLYKKTPELSREALSRAQFSGEVLYQAERDVFGFDYASVSGELLRQWKLPNSLRNSVENHISPSSHDDFTTDTAVIHLASLVATALQSESEEVIPSLDEPAWKHAGCAVELLDAAIEEANIQISETYSLIRSDH